MKLLHRHDEAAAEATIEMPKVGFLGALELIFWGLLLGHFVKWAVDSFYYWIVGAPWAPLKDPWDRLVVHLDNLTQHRIAWLHHFINNGQEAPAWWVTLRHDARDLLIGLGVALVVKTMLVKPLRHRKDYGLVRVASTPFLAVLFAAPAWIIIGLFLSKNQFLANHGWIYSGSNPFIIDAWQIVGDRHLQVLVMGIIGGIFAGFALKGPADEGVWVWAERGHRIGPPGLRVRHAFLAAHPDQSKVKRDQEDTQRSGRVVRRVRNFAVGFSVLVFLVAVGYGFWLTTWGAASHAA